MAMVTEFIAAINQIASERGIDPESVYVALENAVLAAFKKEYDYSSESLVTVEMDRESGEFRVIVKKEVVETVEDETMQISLKEAKSINSGLEVGDSVEIEQQVEDFGRIAAQTAKQVIMQSIREAEKDAILVEYSGKVGEVFTAMMQRMQGGSAIFEIGKALASMPSEEQVGNEFYRIGDRYKVLLKAIEDTPRGRTLIVSRSAPEFLKELFKMEVPEIDSGVVEIKECAREAGSRSKMAVVSHQDGVDAIGSCVGQRGVRIANVMSELGEEKIDIIEWREDINEFVEKALSPAQVIGVDIKDDVAYVEVEEDQLSLAIGKDGQNVRLAAKLTGLKIDIQGPGGHDTKSVSKANESEEVTDLSAEALAKAEVAETDKKETKKAKKSATKTKKVKSDSFDEKLAKKLEKAGKTPEEVAGWSVEQLIELEGIGKATAEKIAKAI